MIHGSAGKGQGRCVILSNALGILVNGSRLDSVPKINIPFPRVTESNCENSNHSKRLKLQKGATSCNAKQARFGKAI